VGQLASIASETTVHRFRAAARADVRWNAWQTGQGCIPVSPRSGRRSWMRRKTTAAAAGVGYGRLVQAGIAAPFDQGNDALRLIYRPTSETAAA
jgi:hypothetical protein